MRDFKIFVETLHCNVSTQEQLEQNLSDCIQDVYLKTFGHQPQQISYKLIDKNLIVIIEDSITQPEQVLISSGKEELAQ